MGKMSQVIHYLYKNDQEARQALNISRQMLHRIKSDDRHVRPWLMKYLVQRYRINPLFIYDDAENMILEEDA